MPFNVDVATIVPAKFDQPIRPGGSIHRLDPSQQSLLIGISRLRTENEHIRLRGERILIPGRASDPEAAFGKPSLNLIIKYHVAIERVAEQLKLKLKLDTIIIEIPLGALNNNRSAD